MTTLVRWIGPGLVAALGLALPAASRAQGTDPVTPPEPVLSQEIRENGPPADRPADDPGPPPGPGLFYVPGEFFPERDGVVWREGYWAAEQTGWTWIPARWVRQSDGWVFRDGSWVRSAPAAPAAPARVEAAVQVDPAPGEQDTVIFRDGIIIDPFEGFGAPPALGFGYGSVGIIPRNLPPFIPATVAYPYGGWWGGSAWGWPAWGAPYGAGFGGPGWGGWGWMGPGFGVGIGLGFGCMPFL